MFCRKVFSVILTTGIKWTTAFNVLLSFSMYLPVFGPAIHDFDSELSWACCAKCPAYGKWSTFQVAQCDKRLPENYASSNPTSDQWFFFLSFFVFFFSACVYVKEPFTERQCLSFRFLCLKIEIVWSFESFVYIGCFWTQNYWIRFARIATKPLPYNRGSKEKP